jgi:hypothetical protein
MGPSWGKTPEGATTAQFPQLLMSKRGFQGFPAWPEMSFSKRRIKMVSIDELKPYERNARTHSDDQIDQIAASLREFGWTNPVLIDGSGGIIAGHARVQAAKQLGFAHVPCIELAGLSEAQKRAYIIADNKLAATSATNVL